MFEYKKLVVQEVTDIQILCDIYNYKRTSVSGHHQPSDMKESTMGAIRVSVHLNNTGVEEGILFKRVIEYADIFTPDKVQIWIKYDKPSIPDMYIKDEIVDSLRVLNPCCDGNTLLHTVS